MCQSFTNAARVQFQIILMKLCVLVYIVHFHLKTKMNTNLTILLCFSVIGLYNCNAASILKLKSGNYNKNINKIKVDVILSKKPFHPFHLLYFFNPDFHQYRKTRGKLCIQVPIIYILSFIRTMEMMVSQHMA